MVGGRCAAGFDQDHVTGICQFVDRYTANPCPTGLKKTPRSGRPRGVFSLSFSYFLFGMAGFIVLAKRMLAVRYDKALENEIESATVLLIIVTVPGSVKLFLKLRKKPLKNGRERPFFIAVPVGLISRWTVVSNTLWRRRA